MPLMKRDPYIRGPAPVEQAPIALVAGGGTGIAPAKWAMAYGQDGCVQLRVECPGHQSRWNPPAQCNKRRSCKR